MGSKNEMYVISLDAVDINLLPTSYKYGHEKVVPLWTKSNLDLRNNDYYEFEIRSNENVQPDKKDIAIESVTCHICDLDVPRVYLNEHRDSFIHRFNTKIADVALKRLQMYMTSNDTVSDNIARNTSTYYCRECSTIVNYADEISHKKSRPHKNSVVLERFLNDFLNLYTNDDDEKTRDVKTEIQIDNEYEIVDKKEHTDNKEIAKNPTDKIVDKPKVNIEDYLKVLNDKYKTNPMFLKANGAYIDIEVIDGSIVRVCEESFHALRKIGQKFIQCMMCKNIFDLESYNDHIMSDGHMKMVSLPLKDKHCVRQISNSRRHCVVCNTIIIEGTDIHTLSNPDHSNNLQNLLIYDKVNEIQNISDTNVDSKALETVSAPKLLYNDVLKSIPSKAKANNVITNIETNKNNTKSRSNEDTNEKRFCNACNVLISIKKIKKHESTMKHVFNTKSDNHYLLKIVDVNLLRCKICQIDVVNHYDDIDKHFSNVDHVNKYDRLLNLNSIRRIDEITFYCADCNVYILFKNEYLHIESKEHKIQSQIKDNRNAFTTDEAIVETATTVEEIVVPNVDRVEQTTNFSKIVVGNVEPVTNVNTVEQIKSVGNIIDHVPNVSKTIKSVINDNKTVEPLPSSNDTVKKVETLVKPDANIVNDTNYFFCLICQVKVPNNYHNIKIHNEGRPHKKNLDILCSKILKTLNNPVTKG